MVLPDLFFQRKYGIILALFIFHAINGKYCEAQSLNSFRTARTGYFNSLSTWQKFNGEEWVPAERLPSREDEIYIENPYRVSLRKNEEIGNVFLNAESGAGQKLNLNGYAIEVYGTMNAYSGAAPGIPGGTWNSQNWIGNSEDSRIIFKGDSRVIIKRGAWSGFNTNSRFSVEFDPGEDKILVVEEHFKSIGFTIKSGTILQKENRSVNPVRCATFSANSEGHFGNGRFKIEAFGSLISECSANIAFRSESNRLMGLFKIEKGGRLELLNTNPEINAADLILEGEVAYAGSSGTQNFLKNYGQTVSIYHDLSFRNGAAKNFPPEITLTGNFIYENGGDIRDASTQYFFRGEQNQVIDRQSKPMHRLQVDKSAGEVSFRHSLIVQNGFEHIGGDLNFNGNSLRLISPDYFYLLGSWRNLSQFVFEQVPPVLDELNGKFPFYDMQLGGQRSFKVLGEFGPTSTPLTIKYVEKPGVNWDAGFSDLDGTPILYKLNSYFEVLSSPFANELELKIDADDLVVTDPLHLRVVGDRQAAPGMHLEGVELTSFWARRNLDYGDLASQTFTIGSTTFPSILPLTWLGIWAKSLDSGILVEWEVAQERDNEKFVVYRSDGNAEGFYPVGEVQSKGNGGERRVYSFVDRQLPKRNVTYFQIRQVDVDGTATYSRVVVLRAKMAQDHMFSVFPNPYREGPLELVFSQRMQNQKGLIKVTGVSGAQVLLREGVLEEMKDLPELLKQLVPGLYLIECNSGADRQVVKFFKF